MTITHASSNGGRRRDDAGVVEALDATVRELVRREGVDPQRDGDVVRRIADRVVREHDERSLTGMVSPVVDVEALVGELVARVAGFGPLQVFLDDPTVEEVWINDPSRVFVARQGRHELTNLVLTRAQVDELVERMLKSSGRRLDVSSPFVDAMLPEGHRLHVVLDGISRGFTAVNIRKFVLRAARLSDLVGLGSLSPRAASFLEASVRAGLNILVAGSTQADTNRAHWRPGRQVMRLAGRRLNEDVLASARWAGDLRIRVGEFGPQTITLVAGGYASVLVLVASYVRGLLEGVVAAGEAAEGALLVGEIVQGSPGGAVAVAAGLASSCEARGLGLELSPSPLRQWHGRGPQRRLEHR